MMSKASPRIAARAHDSGNGTRRAHRRSLRNAWCSLLSRSLSSSFWTADAEFLTSVRRRPPRHALFFNDRTKRLYVSSCALRVGFCRISSLSVSQLFPRRPCQRPGRSGQVPAPDARSGRTTPGSARSAPWEQLDGPCCHLAPTGSVAENGGSLLVRARVKREFRSSRFLCRCTSETRTCVFRSASSAKQLPRCSSFARVQPWWPAAFGLTCRGSEASAR